MLKKAFWISGKLCDKLLSGDQFAMSTHINTVQRMLTVMVPVMMIATQWDMLEPFIPVSIVSHNEVILFIVTVEIEKHQRSVLCSSSTLDEYIHSFPLSLLLFSLGSSSLFSVSFRIKSLCCRSLLAEVASSFFLWNSSPVGISWTNPSFPSKTFFFYCLSFSRLNLYLATAGGEGPTTGSNTQNYLYLLIQRRGHRTESLIFHPLDKQTDQFKG